MYAVLLVKRIKDLQFVSGKGMIPLSPEKVERYCCQGMGSFSYLRLDGRKSENNLIDDASEWYRNMKHNQSDIVGFSLINNISDDHGFYTFKDEKLPYKVL